MPEFQGRNTESPMEMDDNRKGKKTINGEVVSLVGIMKESGGKKNRIKMFKKIYKLKYIVLI